MSETSNSFRTIHVSQFGGNANISGYAEQLVQEKGAIRFRDAFYFRLAEGEAWLFTYGVLVCWNLNADDRQFLYQELKNIIEDLVPYNYSEHYRYQLNEVAEFRIQHDSLIIPNDDLLTRLALSHAFAQSSTLVFFEERAQEVIEKNKFISKELAAMGKISLSRRELAKLRGILFDTSSDITLHFNLLDTPEFFWDYPEHEHYYQALVKYLDLSSRITVLNKKLSTIHELLEMLAAEQHHKHSSTLEWIIIILIAMEIVLFFFPNHP